MPTKYGCFVPARCKPPMPLTPSHTHETIEDAIFCRNEIIKRILSMPGHPNPTNFAAICRQDQNGNWVLIDYDNQSNIMS